MAKVVNVTQKGGEVTTTAVSKELINNHNSMKENGKIKVRMHTLCTGFCTDLPCRPIEVDASL